ncbi:MAG: 30S ribosomal protein S21 [Gemmatimonadales bacterium]
MTDSGLASGPFLFWTKVLFPGRDMVQVTLREDDKLDWALKEFRRKMVRSGLFKDMKKQRFYEKPSITKRRKAVAAERRRARAKRRALTRKWS